MLTHICPCVKGRTNKTTFLFSWKWSASLHLLWPVSIFGHRFSIFDFSFSVIMFYNNIYNCQVYPRCVSSRNLLLKPLFTTYDHRVFIEIYNGYHCPVDSKLPLTYHTIKQILNKVYSLNKKQYIQLYFISLIPSWQTCKTLSRAELPCLQGSNNRSLFTINDLWLLPWVICGSCCHEDQPTHSRLGIPLA